MGRSALFLVILVGRRGWNGRNFVDCLVLRLLEETCFLEKRIHLLRTGFRGESCGEVTVLGFCGIERDGKRRCFDERFEE